jgi:hypothetical protein
LPRKSSATLQLRDSACRRQIPPVLSHIGEVLLASLPVKQTYDDFPHDQTLAG